MTRRVAPLLALCTGCMRWRPQPVPAPDVRTFVGDVRVTHAGGQRVVLDSAYVYADSVVG